MLFDARRAIELMFHLRKQRKRGTQHAHVLICRSPSRTKQLSASVHGVTFTIFLLPYATGVNIRDTDMIADMAIMPMREDGSRQAISMFVIPRDTTIHYMSARCRPSPIRRCRPAVCAPRRKTRRAAQMLMTRRGAMRRAARRRGAGAAPVCWSVIITMSLYVMPSDALRRRDALCRPRRLTPRHVQHYTRRRPAQIPLRDVIAARRRQPPRTALKR